MISRGRVMIGGRLSVKMRFFKNGSGPNQNQLEVIRPISTIRGSFRNLYHNSTA